MVIITIVITIFVTITITIVVILLVVMMIGPQRMEWDDGVTSERVDSILRGGSNDGGGLDDGRATECKRRFLVFLFGWSKT